MNNTRSEQYEKDNLGNFNPKLDNLRAQEGSEGGDANGYHSIASGETGSNVVLYTPPRHADEYYLDKLELHLSSDAGAAGTVQVLEAELDDSDSITSTTVRTVPYEVGVGENVTVDYRGGSFSGSIAVTSDVEADVAASVVVDHFEHSEKGLE